MIARRSLFLLVLLWTAPASAAADPDRYMPTRLIAQTAEPRPGSTILVGFQMAPKAGWHGYWSNPGDSGIIPTVRWTAPSGVTFGPLLHPAPTLISDSGIDSYVHNGPHVLLARMKVPASIAPGTAIPVKAKLSWAACTATQCVPLSATFSLDLVAGDGSKGPDSAALQSAQRKLPRSVGNGSFSASGKAIELRLPPEARLNPSRTRFFPDDNDSFETASGRASKGDGGIVISGRSNAPNPSKLSGVATDGRSAYRIAFVRGPAEPVIGDSTETTANAMVEAEAEATAGADQPVMADNQGNPVVIQQQDSPADSPDDRPFPWLAVAGGLLALGGLAAFAFARRKRT